MTMHMEKFSGNVSDIKLGDIVKKKIWVTNPPSFRFIQVNEIELKGREGKDVIRGTVIGSTWKYDQIGMKNAWGYVSDIVGIAKK